MMDGCSNTLPGPVQRLFARLAIPTSKSLTNRALIAAAAAGGGVIESPLDCEDTRLLAAALDGAGWPVSFATRVDVGAREPDPGRCSVDLGNSGTGARLILSLLAALPGESVVDGTARLRQRPMSPLLEALGRLGAKIEAGPGGLLPAYIVGRNLVGGELELRPGPSSQFVTSLLMAAPLMRDGMVLDLKGDIPSRPYLDLTEDVLTAFGGMVTRSADGRSWRVASGGLKPTIYAVEGDWSAAAFMLAAVAVVGGSVVVEPLSASSRQGDRSVCDILQRAGMVIDFDEAGVVAKGPVSAPLEADLSDSPDLFPALAVVAAAAPRGSVLRGLDHLQHKESDRLSVMIDNLQRLGVRCVADGSCFEVQRPFGRAKPGTAVTAADDHRVAMAMAVASLVVGPLELDDISCVQKSFPSFWQQWALLLEQES